MLLIAPCAVRSEAKRRLAAGLLVEKCGGKTSDGVTGASILDTKITGIDQRTPLCIGSAKEVSQKITLLRFSIDDSQVRESAIEKGRVL